MALNSRILKNKSGQGIIEYLLVLFLAITMASVLARFSKTSWDKGILGFGGSLEKALKTGRAPASAWKN